MGIKFVNKKELIKFLKSNLFTLIVLILILAGFLIGILTRSYFGSSDYALKWISLPGDLFIRSLQLLMVPVVFVGVTTACSSLSLKNNLRITLICSLIVILTHLIATSIGIFGSFLLKLKTFSNENEQTNKTSFNSTLIKQSNFSKQKNAYDIINDLLSNMIPKNLVRAAFTQQLTKYYPIRNANGTIEKFEAKIEYPESSNILGLLTFSILLGLVSSFVSEEKSKLFRAFFSSFNAVLLQMLKWFVLFTPIGMCSLIIEAVYSVESLSDSFRKVGLFTLVCFCCLIFYGLFVLSTFLLLFLKPKRNPLRYYLDFIDPALLAFASTSGAVCMHKSMEVCETKIKMDMRVAEFSIPFYTALQSDGSSLFITCACGFMAHYANINLSTGDYITIILMACILCLCQPSVPSASIATLLVILEAINVPSTNVFLLFMVEWILDRTRTTVNVYSHCLCSVLTFELTKNSLSANINQNQETENDNNGNNILNTINSDCEEVFPLNDINKIN